MISSVSLICAVAFFIRPTTGHVDLPSATASHLEGERAHIGAHHMGVDVNSLAEDELRFMYFRMHDADGDSRLDGCELVKSLLHWHHEESQANNVPIFGNDELALMVDPVLSADDRNADGFIDYTEFVAAQKARGF